MDLLASSMMKKTMSAFRGLSFSTTLQDALPDVLSLQEKQLPTLHTFPYFHLHFLFRISFHFVVGHQVV